MGRALYAGGSGGFVGAHFTSCFFHGGKTPVLILNEVMQVWKSAGWGEVLKQAGADVLLAHQYIPCMSRSSAPISSRCRSLCTHIQTGGAWCILIVRQLILTGQSWPVGLPTCF